MFNLIPVVMFLLLQGAGGDGLTVRQQQALLDLAHRAHAVQVQGELETVLAAQSGVDLAFWIQVFSAVGVETPAAAMEAGAQERASVDPPDVDAGPLSVGWTASVRPRDGPSAI